MKLLNLKKKSANQVILITVIFILFSVKFNLFYNLYFLFSKDDNFRMVNSYGYCSPMGYGYIKKLTSKYKINFNEVNVKNKKIYPSSAIFLPKFNSRIENYKIDILLNYNFEDLKKINKKFKILDNEGNCFLIQYYDD